MQEVAEAGKEWSDVNRERWIKKLVFSHQTGFNTASSQKHINCFPAIETNHNQDRDQAAVMVFLHSLDYLFAIGTIFAFLDAWNIGANDVANSFATSVSSRSLTYMQAMGIASVMEFSGRSVEPHRWRIGR